MHASTVAQGLHGVARSSSEKLHGASIVRSSLKHGETHKLHEAFSMHSRYAMEIPLQTIVRRIGKQYAEPSESANGLYGVSFAPSNDI